MTVNPDAYFATATLLFTLGVLGVIARRNLLVIYLSIELMLNAVNLILATFSRLRPDEGGAMIALLMIGGAVQKFLDKVRDEQEVLGHIADIMMEVYAMESVVNRVKKMAQAKGEDAVSIYVDVARTYVNDALNRVRLSAEQILPIIESGDTLRTYMTMLRRFTKYTPINTAMARRRIADHMVEAEKYNL